MDLRALRYFVAAVNEGSISAAALSCHVAQPSITLAISKLEDQFDCQLLERHPKGVDTTPKGRELYQMATDLLLHADTVEAQLSQKNEKLRLCMKVSENVQVSYVEYLVKACGALNKHIEFEIVDDLADADVALCSRSFVSTSSALNNSAFYPISGESYALVIPHGNPLAFKHTLGFDDLNGQPMIERFHCENRALLDKVTEHYQLSLPIVARVQNEELALSLVATGIGISISPLPRDYSDPRFKVRFLDELLEMEMPERQVGFCLSANASAQVRTLLEELSQYLIKTSALKD